MDSFNHLYSQLKARRFLILVIVTLTILALYANESRRSVEDSAFDTGYEFRPQVTEIHIGESVTFELVDKATGGVVEAFFEIETPHNVPGDRGVFIGNTYNAPRWLTHEDYVILKARARGDSSFTRHAIEVFKNGWPRIDETAKPGLSHMQPQQRPRFEPSIENGLKLGSSTKVTVSDGFGGDAEIAYIQIEHKGNVVQYAGTISDEGVYTAPDEMISPPEITIRVIYYDEGGSPGDTSQFGSPIVLRD